uniref:Zinc finger, CCHC-type n=1 Tax=Tanacetum cinerariifolium TaxID=118510 RepID=A0A6L2N0X1_TANCI|nr:zinc finger, CCHC-type [Tanacetum cinerariifolium]
MADTIKHMVANFSKLDKFEGMNFRRWQKKMHFFLTRISVVYVLSIPIHNDSDEATVEEIRKKRKWESDDYVCRDLIMGMNFRRWQRKMHFFLTRISVVYVLSIPIHNDSDEATMEEIRKKRKWESDDYVCRDLILGCL